MATYRSFRRRAAGVFAVLSVGALLTACDATDSDAAGQRFTVLTETETTEQIPAVLEGSDVFAEASLRELGTSEQYRYFVARDSTAPQSTVCLMSVDSVAETWASSCGSVTNASQDPVVTLGQGAGRHAGLVSDDADPGVLEANGWERVADNLWVSGEED